MPSSALALITTVHLSLFVMRRHRSRPSGADILILLPAVLFSGVTWLPLPTTWIFGTMGVHLAWFAFCEKKYPPINAAAVAARVPAAEAPRRMEVPRPAIAAPARGPLTVPVLAVFDETPDIKTFRFQRPDGFDFTAGQFLTIRVQADGKAIQRAYSISSSPHAPGYLEISVKRIGLVSGVLHANLRPGALVTVRPPAGTFVYPKGDDRPLVLLAGGIGITPLMSMLRHAVAADPTRRVTLIYSVQTPDGLAFRDELATIGRRHPQVRLAVCVTQGPASDRWHSGHINGAIVRAYVPDPANALFYICGPKPMMEAMTAMLAELNVPAAQVRTESFGAAMKLVAATDTVDEAPHSTASREALIVRFARSGCDARIAPNVTVLEAAEANGVDIPSMCRAGSCQTCRTRVLQGDVTCDSDALSPDDRAAGFILPCVSHAVADCVIEA